MANENKDNKEKKEDEYLKSLSTIYDNSQHIREMSYFIELAVKNKKYTLFDGKRPDVVVLDFNFPEEIMEALGLKVAYIVGGCFKSAVDAENLVPRDTDSVIKSILGLLSEGGNLYKKSVILVPINCDSMRKIVYMLKNYYRVIPIEVPSDRSNDILCDRWINEIERVTYKLSRIFSTMCSKSKLNDAISRIKKARECYKKLENNYRKYSGIIDGSAIMFIANSYLWETKKDVWARNVDLLAYDVSMLGKRFGGNKSRPKVLLMGSPIYFPNYKIPFLLEELGMEIVENITPVNAMLQRSVVETSSSRKDLIQDISMNTLKQDIAPAYVNNIALFRKVRKAVKNNELNGVVYHVLKGQIEYDFELKYIETFLEENDIPVFRLETDYNYQDVEQLRIRLEAFYEMITQKMIVDSKSA